MHHSKVIPENHSLKKLMKFLFYIAKIIVTWQWLGTTSENLQPGQYRWRRNHSAMSAVTVWHCDRDSGFTVLKIRRSLSLPANLCMQEGTWPCDRAGNIPSSASPAVMMSLHKIDQAFQCFPGHGISYVHPYTTHTNTHTYACVCVCVYVLFREKGSTR